MPVVEAQRATGPAVFSAYSAVPRRGNKLAYLVDPYKAIGELNGIKTIVHKASFRRKPIRRGFVNMQRFDQVVIERRVRETLESMSGVN